MNLCIHLKKKKNSNIKLMNKYLPEKKKKSHLVQNFNIPSTASQVDQVNISY